MTDPSPVNLSAAADPRLAIGRRLVEEVLDPMKRTFVAKDEIIDLLGICLVAGENLFILGPPGTAKSALVYDLGWRLRGRTFSYLLTRFTEPSEIFGPFDIRRLREGDLVTNTEGMLPEASLVFLDELLNANSAILNSLLTVLNERMFRRGRETYAVPILMAVGASNSLPEDEALVALFDRFLMRVRCDNVPADRLAEVLEAGLRLDLAQVERATTLGVEDIRKLQEMLPVVDLSAVRPAYVEMVRRLRQAGIAVSDRRAVKFQRLMAASALVCGRTRAAVSDFWVLRNVWDREEQQEVLAALVQEDLAKDASPERVHPQARAAEAPDPEALARDLELIERRLDQGSVPADDLGRLRDQLGVLAGRCQWVAAEEQRMFLLERATGLMDRVGGSA